MIWNMPPTCTAALWGRFSQCLPEETEIKPLLPPPPSQSLLSPQSSSGKYLKATEVGVPFDVYIGWLLFLVTSFFFNNQSSRKCGELTAWQQQRNSLEKLRWILLRFQALKQESQRSNRPLVVFNHFFCGTFLVPETNLSVLHEGAWEHRPSAWRLWFGDYYSNISCPFWTPFDKMELVLLGEGNAQCSVIAFFKSVSL